MLLARVGGIGTGHSTARETCFGAIELVKSDFRTYLDQTEADSLLFIVVVMFHTNLCRSSDPGFMKSMLNITRDSIDASEEPAGYTALHQDVAGCFDAVGQLV